MTRARLLHGLLLVAMIAGVLVLSGCATPAPGMPLAVLVAAPLPCPAAQETPEAPPPRTLNLDASKPGEAVKAYAGNRARWIGYADALRTKLDACK